MSAITVRSVVVTALFGAVFLSPHALRAEASKSDVPARVSASDWQGIRAAHEAWKHEVRKVDGGWEAQNPAQQLTTTFDGRGFVAKPANADWTWGLELRAYGAGDVRRNATGSPKVRAEGQRLAYHWDDTVQEWFVNDGRGLEHGYSVQERPPGPADAPLSFLLATRGPLIAKVTSDARAVDYRTAAGSTVLTYSGLRVWDADGRDLESRFVPAEGGVELQVDAAGARYPVTIDPIARQAYLKASNAGSGDEFGGSVAISGDTLVVGAPSEKSAATGVNGNQADNSFVSGAVYVFVRSGEGWIQQAYLKASNTDVGDDFGESVAISGDTLVVGASYEDGNDISMTDSGAAYVFVRSGTTWTQQAYLKASNADSGDRFGNSVAISGETIVVGAIGENSAATGVDGDQSINSAENSGAAYVFARSGTIWSQQAYLKASNTGYGDNFGGSVAISGETIVVGASFENSAATGVDGDQDDNNALLSGAAYVFVRNGASWSQQAYLKASNTGASDYFGGSVAIAGETIVVGANGEDSAATGIDGNQADNNAPLSGAAYVFARNGTSWSQQAYLKASNAEVSSNYIGQFGFGENFSKSVAISGETIVVGANGEDSAATGVDGNQANNSALNSGAVYVFTRNGTSWSQQAYLKALNTGADDYFGRSVAISGETLVVGAPYDNGIAQSSGAAYACTISPDAVQPPPLMDVATVGDAGNAADSAFRGAVAYDYFLGQYEVTIRQYTAFLNSVARSNTHSHLVNLWKPAMATNGNVAGIARTGSGVAGDLYSYSVIGSGERPIAYVNWHDAARFANWMHNGASGGADTESGAYTLNGATSTSNSTVPAKNPGATWWIPSLDEWYKAAFYKSGGTNAGYWMYPTQSDFAPDNSTGTATNQANFYAGDFAVTQGEFWAADQNYLTNIGTFRYSASPYGTFDQAGNLAEWVSFSTPGGDARSWSGGSWRGIQESLKKSTEFALASPQEQEMGFRVAGAANTDADLSELALNGVSLNRSFVSSQSSYLALVPFSKSSVSLTPEVAQTGAKVMARVNGGNYWSVASGTLSTSLPLNVGLNHLEVRVTAASGKIAKNYTLVVARGSADAGLSALSLSSSALSPAFSTSVLDYTAETTTQDLSVTVTPTAAQANSTIDVRMNGGNYTSVASGSPSGALPLILGNNTVEVKVTAQNALDSKIYTISTTRLPSSNANLAGLSLSAGTLSPAFSEAMNYTASVDFSTVWTSVTPLVAQANATVQVRVNGGYYSAVANGTASDTLALSVGNNMIDVKVTAQDGTTTKTYTLVVARGPMTIETVAVGDAGNAADFTGYGAVSYPYRIGKYEITLGEYAEFLNAVAKTSDPYGLYPIGWGGPELMRADVAGISRDYSNGVYTYTPVTPIGLNPVGANSPANRPVSYMTLFNAARFANWLANGQPSGAQDATTTEDGAYALNGATSGAITRNATNPNTGAPPTWWIPTENEWYKAAYYKGGGTNAGYWLYPTQSDTKPGNAIGGTSNQANHKVLNDAGNEWVYSVPNAVNALYSQNRLTDVGAFSNSASAYGTFDQGGNVWEWSYVPAGDSYPIRGGDYGSANTDSRDFLKSSADQVLTPANWKGYSGFRVASAPVLPPRIVTMTRGLNGFSLSWADAPNVHVQRRTSLSEGSWQTISSNNITGSYLDLATPTSRAFYRLILP